MSFFLLMQGGHNNVLFSRPHLLLLERIVQYSVSIFFTTKSLLASLFHFFPAFDIGHTCNAKTMGVWIMCLPHPTQESQVLVLLDTEGLGAVLEVVLK